MKAQPRILVIVGHQDLCSKIEGILNRESLQVSHVTSGSSALVLVGNIDYDLLVVEDPLPDLSLSEFLGSLRALDSSCSTAGALILSHESEIVLPPGLVGAPIEVLPIGSPESTIHRLISRLLGVAARRKGRVRAELKVELHAEKKRLVLRSTNLSESGLLLQGGLSVQTGSQVLYRFTLDGSEEPVSGKGQVARHTGPAESPAGIAIQFLNLGEQSRAALRRFVQFGGSGPRAHLAASAPRS